jgi:hypothetical protein
MPEVTLLAPWFQRATRYIAASVVAMVAIGAALVALTGFGIFWPALIAFAALSRLAKWIAEP